MSGETTIRVGVMTGHREIRGCFHGDFRTPAGETLTGPFVLNSGPPPLQAGGSPSGSPGNSSGSLSDIPDSPAWSPGASIYPSGFPGASSPPSGNGDAAPGIWLKSGVRRRYFMPSTLRFHPEGQATFSLEDVTIGVNFHWERRERQRFQGSLAILADNDGLLTALNEIDIEDYLASVISSEMAATAPLEFLKAHAVISRSWLLTMLERKGLENPDTAAAGIKRMPAPDSSENIDRTQPAPERAARTPSSGGLARKFLMEEIVHNPRIREPRDEKKEVGQATRGREGTAENDDPEMNVPGEVITDFPEEIIKWHGREEHACFDVCADDHCQRYQGVTKIVSAQVREAIDATRGLILMHGGRICDARYHKACGGRTEDFANVWEERPVPYLTSIADGPEDFPSLATEAAAADWIFSSPAAYCNTGDMTALRWILPAFDQETPDFFRWEVAYERRELEELLKEKSGIDFGELLRLTPLSRGPSGRIIRLEIAGTRRTVIVGKELEIRRWLSPSHLYSSAFVVATEKDARGSIRRFILRGAGWGHGVGLCQIGAAMMAIRGFSMTSILKHYFPGAEFRKINQ